jgi:thiol:disulfide interchange protein
MRRHQISALALISIALSAPALVGARQAAPPAASRTAEPSFPGPTAKFDYSRDAAKDIQAAAAEAKRTNRRVILDVGGEWCGWCHTLDRYFVAHTELQGLRDRNFVWLKVNYSKENRNEAVLSRYPAIKGYPHLFVLNSDGTLLHSQDTVLLEEGSSYNLDRMREFLVKWSPPR